MSLEVDRAQINRFGFVTPAMRADLEHFVALLHQWQAIHNLVSSASLAHLWSRHIADSLQLLDHAPKDFRSWIDLGSGAGFPGLIVALACRENPERGFRLIESNYKKVAFLRAAIRQANARAEVVAQRIQAYAASGVAGADVISARALAPVVDICGLAAPLLKERDSTLLLLKGQDFAREIEVAAKSWDFDVVSTPSVTDPQARVLTLRNLRQKVHA